MAPPSDEPGASEPGSGGSGGSDPSTGSGGGQPGAETPAVEKASLGGNGTTLALTGWGGVCAEYTAVADESSTAVTVQIVGRSTLGPDEACIEMAQEITVVVELASPLGDRTILDSTTGLPVPVTRT